ncbi:hypothetical protein L195_g063577, partial [Trifolium pratense]
SLCVITPSSIPGMSEGFHANRSALSFRILMILLLSWSGNAVPRLVVWCG